MSLSHSQKLRFQQHDMIAFCTGISQLGEPYWVYLQVNREQAERLTRDQAQGKSLYFSEYGLVLKTGPGLTPPAEAVSFMKNIYHFEN